MGRRCPRPQKGPRAGGAGSPGEHIVEGPLVVVAAALAGLLCTAFTAALGGRTLLQALALGLAGALGNLAWAALTATAAAGIVTTMEGKWDVRLWKGLACYWLFLLSWLPITAVSFWKKTTVWKEIRHTRAVVPQLPGR